MSHVNHDQASQPASASRPARKSCLSVTARVNSIEQKWASWKNSKRRSSSDGPCQGQLVDGLRHWCLGGQWAELVHLEIWTRILYTHNGRKCRSQTSDLWADAATVVGRVRGERCRRKKISARKGRKVAKRCVFPMFCGSGGSKSRHAKAAGAGHVAGWKINTCTQPWREAHVEVKRLKAPGVRSTFDSCAPQKVHTPAAWSKFKM